MADYYEKIFGSVLTEFTMPDTSRKTDDIQFDPDTDTEAFNVDPMDANVGYKTSNVVREVKELKTILSDVTKMSSNMKYISKQIASLSRSFADIGKTSKTVATINQKLHDLNGELEGYIISLPAQSDETSDMTHNNEGDV